jgi:uncharacterized protein YqgV (UPF0045/DUF77 family)
MTTYKIEITLVGTNTDKIYDTIPKIESVIRDAGLRYTLGKMQHRVT